MVAERILEFSEFQIPLEKTVIKAHGYLVAVQIVFSDNPRHGKVLEKLSTVGKLEKARQFVHEEFLEHFCWLRTKKIV